MKLYKTTPEASDCYNYYGEVQKSTCAFNLKKDL